MGLKRVDVVPVRGDNYDQLDRDLEEFCTSCMGCAELVGYSSPVSGILDAARYRISRSGYPCKVLKRGDSVFLVRDYGKSEAWRRNRGEGNDAA